MGTWKRLLLLVFVGMNVSGAMAQRLTVASLLKGVAQEPEVFDTLLRAHHFIMDPVAQDSTGTIIRYYNQVAKSDEGITWIRSVTVTEIQVRGITSRLLNYRMYDEAEYRDHLMWLLEHGYKTRDHFVFRGYKTVIYSDGVHVLTLKEGKRLLPNKRMVSAYEIEVGQ